MPLALASEVRNAVAHLAGPPEYLTLAAFAERAFTHELERLRAQYTDGAAFPPRPTHELHRGRRGGIT